MATNNKSPAPLSDSSDVLLRHLDDAVLLLPDNEKDAYLEALHLAPSLVQRESNPITFLRHENFNLWAASQRLVTYWRMRKEVFGPEAFLKPIHQTGSGALSATDIEILDAGYVRLLPKTAFNGRHVLWWDRDTLTPAQLRQRASRIRAFFYIMQLVMEDYGNTDENEETSTSYNSRRNDDNESKLNLTVVANLTASLVISSDYNFSHQCTELTRQAFPINIAAIHLVSVPGNLASTIMTTSIGVVLQMCSVFSHLALVHVGSTLRDLQQKLRAAGFDKRGLPPKLGGLYKEDKLEQFKRRRCKIEEEMFLSEVEKLSKKRKVNMIHSRQKRERRKIEYEVINEQAQKLMDKNDALKADNKRLEQIIEVAQQAVMNPAGNLQSCQEILDILLQPDQQMSAQARRVSEDSRPVARETTKNVIVKSQSSVSDERRNELQNERDTQLNLQVQQLLSPHSDFSRRSVDHNLHSSSFRSDSSNNYINRTNESNNFLNALAAVRQIQANNSLQIPNASPVFSADPNLLRPEQISMLLNYNPSLLHNLGNVVPDTDNRSGRYEELRDNSRSNGSGANSAAFNPWQI